MIEFILDQVGTWFGAVEGLGTLGALHRYPKVFCALLAIFMFCTVLILIPDYVVRGAVGI